MNLWEKALKLDIYLISKYNLGCNKGYIISKDRQGNRQRFPIMSLSIGIVSNDKKGMNHYGKIVEVAAEMKKFAKTNRPSKSSIASDKRKEFLSS